VFDEERRLFYVVLTRAVEHLFILTETNNLSPFLEELRNRKTISSVNWSDYQSLVGSIKHLTIKVGNEDGRGGNGTYAIKDLLKAEGYRWRTTGWSAWCRTYPAHNFSIQQFLMTLSGFLLLLELRCGFMTILRRYWRSIGLTEVS
jgi:DNA helicase-4